jgi:glutaredoxin
MLPGTSVEAHSSLFLWSAAAERSGDAALDGPLNSSEKLKASQSGVALRLPPHSKSALRKFITQLLNYFTDGGNLVALVIYTKPGCPYCQQAREYYNSKGMTFIDHDAQTDRALRAEMLKFSGGDPTVPCIVKDGKYVQSGWGDPLRG